MFTCFYIYVILYIDPECENVGPSKCKESWIFQEEGQTPTTINPSDIINQLPWETNLLQCTLQKCKKHYSKLREDIGVSELPVESRESLEIFTHSLSSFLDIYEKLGPTTDSFIVIMRH